MRKMYKKQAEDFIGLIGSAHDEVRAAMEKRNISLVLNLLADCQEGAIALGDMVEKTAGDDGADVIARLEAYCEGLYQIHEQLASGLPVQGQAVIRKKISKTLHSHFILIRNSIRAIKEHREAVFLPYKASMWDSLESVWKAAKEDPNCDAYVIPIPYYDRNSDGSFGEIHYEADQYPADVPVMHYNEYDFEKRRPDMIFIHNPYDECNYVTSVPPFFYSKNIKQFTEKLIYIPYFVLEEIKIDDEHAIADMSKFCLVEGVRNADQVVVQSENMRRVYIEVLTKTSGEKTRGYWEKKILGLGSPKVDKVLSTRKEDLDIPEEWMEIIRKPDGSWKKIILYNTSVTALLQYSDQMIAKIQEVFRIFYENREEAVLLWRPHPLIEATIRSMRPKLWAKYREIVERYCAQGWGIFDESADLDRAVALSDAYYGDWSRIVWLYEKTEKPILHQNPDILSNQDDALSIADMVRYHDKLFILTRDTCSLFEYDLTAKKMKWCGLIKRQREQVFICMAVCEGKVYIAPYEADYISVYDIETETFDTISLKQLSGKRKNKYYHWGFSYGKKVFFLGTLQSTMLSVDVQDGTVYEVTDWMEEWKQMTGEETAVRTHTDKCVVEDCFWVALDGSNVLLQYNMTTGEYRFWPVGDSQFQYVTVNYDGRYFWLSGDRKAIVRWEKETGEVREIADFPAGFEAYNEKGEEMFYCCYPWKDALYFAPLRTNMLVRLELKTEKMECVLLKSDSRFSGCELTEIDAGRLYMEVMDDRGNRRDSYAICGENGHYSYAIKADREKEIEKMMASGFTVENNPACLKLFLAKERTDGSINKNDCWMGKEIYETVLEKE